MRVAFYEQERDVLAQWPLRLLRPRHRRRAHALGYGTRRATNRTPPSGKRIVWPCGRALRRTLRRFKLGARIGQHHVGERLLERDQVTARRARFLLASPA